MESGSIVSMTIALTLIAITGFAIYIAFGPPSEALDDPFEDHED